jgi:hypothetical protein
MKLTFIYQSVKGLPAALAFYRDELGLDEAWREGESTVAFELPGSPVGQRGHRPSGRTVGIVCRPVRQHRPHLRPAGPASR